MRKEKRQQLCMKMVRLLHWEKGDRDSRFYQVLEDETIIVSKLGVAYAIDEIRGSMDPRTTHRWTLELERLGLIVPYGRRGWWEMPPLPGQQLLDRLIVRPLIEPKLVGILEVTHGPS